MRSVRAGVDPELKNRAMGLIARIMASILGNYWYSARAEIEELLTIADSQCLGIREAEMSGRISCGLEEGQ